jgi:hypothetical protein
MFSDVKRIATRMFLAGFLIAIYYILPIESVREYSYSGEIAVGILCFIAFFVCDFLEKRSVK